MSKDRCDRYNQGKNRVGLISPTILWALGEVYTYGATKYEDDNWTRGCPYRELADCALRHLLKWLAGHRDDAESGIHHLAMAIWNLGTLLHFEKLPEKYAAFDDRLPGIAAAIPNGSVGKIIETGVCTPANNGEDHVPFQRTVVVSNPEAEKERQEKLLAQQRITELEGIIRDLEEQVWAAEEDQSRADV